MPQFQNLLYVLLQMIKKNTLIRKNIFTTSPETHINPPTLTYIQKHTRLQTHLHKLIHNKRETLFPQMGYDNPIRHAIMLKQSKHSQLQTILLNAD